MKGEANAGMTLLAGGFCLSQSLSAGGAAADPLQAAFVAAFPALGHYNGGSACVLASPGTKEGKICTRRWPAGRGISEA